MEELVKNSIGLQVLTDTGWQNFEGVLNKGIRKTLKLQLTMDSIVVTPNHGIFTSTYKKKNAEQLLPGEKILTSKGIQKVVSIKLDNERSVFDLLNVGMNRRFYANDILCSNCEFVIDEETLIKSTKLADLEGVEPIEKQGQVRWYQKPKKGNIYVVSLDPSLGTGSDPAAIQIFEANSTTQIGEWQHNRTTIPEQIRLLASINEYIIDHTKEPDSLYYSLENNTIGEAALISLEEYGEHNIKGIFISGSRDPASTKRYRKGFNTTNKTKLSACAKLKNLIESDKMTIRSKPLISELKTFVAVGGSYKAKIGENDDLVMATILIVRMLQHLQSFHVELENQIRDFEEFLEPMPFIMSIA